MREPVKFSLSSKFMEGDDWREALKRKPGFVLGAVSAQEKGRTAFNRDLPTVRTLLQENRTLYGELLSSQEKVIQLQKRVEELGREKADLEQENTTLKDDCRKMIEEVAQMDLQNRELASRVAANRRAIIRDS